MNRRDPVRHGRVHPVGWFVPVATSIAAVIAWTAVAHSGGSGWVQTVGALLAAVLAVGLLAPAVGVRRAGVTCRASPPDGQAGRPAVVTLTATGPIRVTPRSPGGGPALAAGAPRGPRTVDVTVIPRHRGLIGSLRVELATCAPFGLLWWAKEVDVSLSRTLYVAPRYSEGGSVGTDSDPTAGAVAMRVPAGLGEPRGVRPYQPGDARGSVHWPATAHTASLMVREKDRETDDRVVLDLVLPLEPEEAERLCERTMTAVSEQLALGRRVLLGTDEKAGHRLADVRDRVDLGRRLARAVPRLARPVTEPELQ